MIHFVYNECITLQLGISLNRANHTKMERKEVWKNCKKKNFLNLIISCNYGNYTFLL
ncbi:hypothetical protein BD770DRAFT_395166 [Pilaira anomala]|nr:hypothetical protein BD770DRAFT_395166 [Pilaira anomala]